MESLSKWLSSTPAPPPSYKGILFSDPNEERNFKLRMEEVSEWCARRMRLEGPVSVLLRSPELKPDVMVGDGGNPGWNHEDDDMIASVKRLNEQRAKLLGPLPEVASDKAGRLLIFWPDETLDCGAAQVSSKGYFDAGNAPPWDTWVWYANLYNQPPALIAWVPGELVDVVDLGISVNPEQCIKWL